MSQPKKKVKKVVKKTSKRVIPSAETKKKIKPTVSKGKSRSAKTTAEPFDMIFKKQNFVLMGIGLVLIVLGLVLMSGGSMPTPDVWDESLIYSARRITLAPILILAGLVVEIVAIFKRA